VLLDKKDAMKSFSWILVLGLAPAVFAQTGSTEIRVTGEHAMTTIDTPDTAKQLALVDAERKTLIEAGARLRNLPEVKILQLEPTQLDAYAAALADIEERSARTSTAAGRPLYQVDVVLRLDAADTVRRLSRLRKDQDASRALLEAWKQAQALARRVAGESGPTGAASSDASQSAQDQQRTLTALRVKHLSAQTIVALARTEERPVGGRAPSAEGRQRARQLAEAALAVSPASPDAHFAIGDVLLDASQLQDAEKEYRTALAANADSSPGHIKLANALLRQQKLPEAGDELREALRIDPASVSAHTDMGWVLKAQSDAAEAIVEYREALRLDPDFIDAHNGLAVTLAGQGRVPEAVSEFREIVRIDPDSAVGYYNLSYALADLDKDEESAAALREVVRINPDHYNAHYNLGELFRLEAKFDEAAKQFREYVRLAPDNTPQNHRNIDRAKDFIKKFEN